MGISRWPHRVREPIDPDAVLDYQIDWSDWLGAGQSLTSVIWSVTGAVLDTATFTATTATAWVSGADSLIGAVTLTCHVVDDSTPQPREDDRTLLITVRAR